MKAEHRKELHTNLLADRLGRLVQGMKSGPQSASAIGWVIAVLAVGIFVIWYLSTGVNPARSTLWASIYDTTSVSKLQDDALTAPGTMPARTAEFQRARILLQTGLEHLYSSQRLLAISDVETARKLYQRLNRESQDDPLLAQETLLGLAKAEEALAGVRNDEGEGNRGDLKKALDYYHQFLQSLARTDPQGAHGTLYKAVDEHVQRLTADDGKDVTDFYAQLGEIAAREAKKKEEKKETPPGP